MMHMMIVELHFKRSVYITVMPQISSECSSVVEAVLFNSIDYYNGIN